MMSNYACSRRLDELVVPSLVCTTLITSLSCTQEKEDRENSVLAQQQQLADSKAAQAENRLKYLLQQVGGICPVSNLSYPP